MEPGLHRDEGAGLILADGYFSASVGYANGGGTRLKVIADAETAILLLDFSLTAEGRWIGAGR